MLKFQLLKNFYPSFVPNKGYSKNTSYSQTWPNVCCLFVRYSQTPVVSQSDTDPHLLSCCQTQLNACCLTVRHDPAPVALLSDMAPWLLSSSHGSTPVFSLSNTTHACCPSVKHHHVVPRLLSVKHGQTPVVLVSHTAPRLFSYC